MKIKLLKTYNLLIAGLLTILGCSTSCIEPKAEYGIPSAKFIVNGKVTSAKTKEPIEKIRVVMQYDTTYTDKNGAYKIDNFWSFPSEQTFNILFLDIDSVENGEFQTLDTIVEFKNPQFSGGDGNWNQGETSKEFNIELTPKNER